MTKKQPQEYLNLKSTTDSTRNRTENKECGEHEQIHIEIPCERKNMKVKRRKNKAGNDKQDECKNNSRA